MNVKLAVVFLFALVAVSQAGHAILNTYSDTNCTSTLIASFATNDPGACSFKKRATEEDSICITSDGVVYGVDFSYCNNDTVPTWPADWQVLQLNTESTCNSSSVSTYYLAAPNNFGPTNIAFYSSLTDGFAPVNTTMACNATSGHLNAKACVLIASNYMCFEFSLAPNTCTVDATNSFFGHQTTCVAPPVAEPVAAPVAGPTTSATPVQAPVANSSSASIIYSSVALLSIIALF